MSDFTHFDSHETEIMALKFANNAYQVGLLYGQRAWSGSDVRYGIDYGCKHLKSRKDLLNRLREAGFAVELVKGQHGRHEYKISLSDRASLKFKLAAMTPDSDPSLNDLRVD
jgi:hypothetical protein